MTDTVEARVARGAAWLDEKYPGWYSKIDLSVLDISDCYQCVLGQVYTGCIPAEERGQLTAQVAKAWADSSGRSESYWEAAISRWGGYSILNELHALLNSGRPYGFLAQRSSDYDPDETEGDYQALLGDYQALLDEWTRVIIQRRLDEHPDVAAQIDAFLANPSTGVRRERPTRQPELVS